MTDDVVERVSEILAGNTSFSRDVANRAATSFGPDWVDAFSEVVRRLYPDPEQLSAAVAGYDAFAFASLRAQKRFEKTRRYPAKTYEEAAREVYHNEKHMLERYLPGLLLSHYFWGHHYRQLRYFEEFFVSAMARGGAQRFAEVGVGTGIYSRVLLQRLPGVTGAGYEISASSKAFAERHIEAFGLGDRFAIELRDIVESRPQERFDWLVCVEVLEHLEDPEAFLRVLRELVPDGGKAFITAALNAPNEDHIYLYETAEEVLAQLRAAGFALEQYFFGAAYAPEAASLPVPCVAAFIVT